MPAPVAAVDGDAPRHCLVPRGTVLLIFEARAAGAQLLGDGGGWITGQRLEVSGGMFL
ncbi:hypothetical protein LOY37_20775 [Pseudomonas sp. B21-012]|nr:hypothetical protein LOY37_20775 [Pseudomonas sp. B21-012]